MSESSGEMPPPVNQPVTVKPVDVVQEIPRSSILREALKTLSHPKIREPALRIDLNTEGSPVTMAKGLKIKAEVRLATPRKEKVTKQAAVSGESGESGQAAAEAAPASGTAVSGEQKEPVDEAIVAARKAERKARFGEKLEVVTSDKYQAGEIGFEVRKGKVYVMAGEGSQVEARLLQDGSLSTTARKADGSRVNVRLDMRELVKRDNRITTIQRGIFAGAGVVLGAAGALIYREIQAAQAMIEPAAVQRLINEPTTAMRRLFEITTGSPIETVREAFLNRPHEVQAQALEQTIRTVQTVTETVASKAVETPLKDLRPPLPHQEARVVVEETVKQGSSVWQMAKEKIQSAAPYLTGDKLNEATNALKNWVLATMKWQGTGVTAEHMAQTGQTVQMLSDRATQLAAECFNHASTGVTPPDVASACDAMKQLGNPPPGADPGINLGLQEAAQTLTDAARTVLTGQ